MTSLSIVVPLFNEQESLPDLVEQLYLAMHEQELHNLFKEPFNFEIIMVDDGSTDNSALVIRNLIISRPELRLISFQRNFGKQPHSQQDSWPQPETISVPLMLTFRMIPLPLRLWFKCCRKDMIW